MKTSYITIKSTILTLLIFVVISCSKRTLPSQASTLPTQIQNEVDKTVDEVPSGTFNYLALGDSYTIGASVEQKSNFPSQLSTALEENLNVKVQLSIIATSGWRTDDLLNALDDNTTEPPYNLVTLLIGVNNQYQGDAFSKYEKEFTELFERSLKLADNNKNRLIIVSIPDWAYTPFGQGFDTDEISKEIDRYNAFAEATASKNDVEFIPITDITRKGLQEKELVASDNLHPSEIAYKEFVDRMLPIILSQLKN